jgi:mono/diheme cytochrome c family protein
MRNTFNIHLLGLVALAAGFTACSAEGDYPGMEYAPQMYHSVPYEPLSQITDKSQGEWLSARADERGEFFNSNPYNPNNMNMRLPAEGTVSRNAQGYLPFRILKDSAGSDTQLNRASAMLKNPLPNTEGIVAEGKVLYTNFCFPCHGIEGRGDGPVGMVYKGVANLAGGQVASATEGHLFYVITHGRGRMWPHDKQISVEDRWKIVRYVQTLQQQGQ